MTALRNAPPIRNLDAPRLRRLALLAAAMALATRVPFAARRLWDHDSVQFALGVEKYDLAAHHPHPPGYPLYIGILKALAALGVDALHGMVALSILATALGAGCIVLLTARLVGEGAARQAGASGGVDATAAAELCAAGPYAAQPYAAAALAASLFVFNPILWFYGELPLVYAIEGGMTVALAYAALRMGDGRLPFVAGCAVFALAGGIRPSTLVLLAPLFLFGVWRAWRRGASPATLAAGGALGVVCGLAWLLPLLAAAGGYAAYQQISREHFGALLPYTSILYGAGWGALAHNLTLITKWFLQGMLPAALAVVVALAAGGRHRIADGLRRLAAGAPLLAVWALPPILFFALFHITKAGYTLVYLPALLTAACVFAAPALAASRTTAAGTNGLSDGRSNGLSDVRTSGLSAGAVAAIVVAAAAGAGLFLFGADRRPEQPRALAIVRHEFNRGSIATYERDLDRLLAILRRLPAATTVLATVELSGTGSGGPEAFLYPWQRHLQWYLPGYEVLHLVPEERFALVTTGHRPFHKEGPTLEIPPDAQNLAIVLSGPTGDRFPLSPYPLRRIGDTFYLVLVPVTPQLQLGPFRFQGARQRLAA